MIFIKNNDLYFKKLFILWQFVDTPSSYVPSEAHKQFIPDLSPLQVKQDVESQVAHLKSQPGHVAKVESLFVPSGQEQDGEFYLFPAHKIHTGVGPEQV